MKYAEVDELTVDPTAGGDVVFTAPENVTIHSLRFSFTTSAAVATRQVKVTAEDASGNVYFETLPPISQTASAGPTVYFGFDALSLTASPGSGRGPIPWPAGGLRLQKGYALRITAINKDAGDDFTAAFMQAERD